MNCRLANSLLALTLLAGSAFAQPTVLSDVRFWSQGPVTRIAINLSAEPVFLQNRLSNPDRVFFDFPNTRPQVGGRLSATIPVGDPQLRQIRVGEAKPGVARLVLDLAANAQLSTEILSNHTRLIIELRQPGAPAPPAKPLVAAPVVSAKAPVRQWSPKPAFASSPEIWTMPPVLATPFARNSIALASPQYPPLRTKSRVAEVAVATPPPPPPPSVNSRAPRAAAPADAAVASLTRALGLKIRRIVLDPGHGGHDQGTAGPTGLTEKEVVLDIGLRLGALLEEGLGAEVIYTRKDDRFIPLEQRTKMANESQADLFLSIHANSSPIKAVSGVETYFLSFTTSKTALETAARENATSERGVFELRDLLQKIALKDKIDESREFASRVNGALYKSWYNPAANVRNRGVKRAPFVVLIGANMPSILTEIGFLSNARDEKELRKPDVRQKIAEALYKGISQYADSLSHFQVAKGGTEEE